MGHTKIRRLIHEEAKWTMPGAKHEHVFLVPCNVRVLVNKKGHVHMMDYSAVKCIACESFVDAKYVDELDRTKPTVHLVKTHFAIGFKGCKILKDK